MTLSPYKISDHLKNPRRDPNAYAELESIISLAECERALGQISKWQGYQVSDLLELTDIADAAGVRQIFYKDESTRFGLGSFKALGGSYAVAEMAQAHRTQHGNLDDFAVATATDGNHGKSVAWGAQRLGIECHIFIHAHVSQARADAMTELGANVHRVSGNYDDSLVDCEKMAKQEGWQIVSDTSWEGYEEVPIKVMAGYSVMASEIVEQLDGQIPTHFFVPAGCGGLAGGLLAYLWQIWKQQLPNVIIVESDLSDCVYQSVKNQHVQLVNIVDETIMAGLSCGEVSRIIWPLLDKGVSDCITMPDTGVIPMMQWLARPSHQNRPPIEGGECSTAGLSALMALKYDAKLRKAVGIDEQSVILVLGTEGATDPEFYQQAMTA